jgi:hypothetical protein
MKTSPSKAEQIRKILTDTPSIPSKQVAKMTGFPLSMVYQTKYNMNKKKKPVGRPRKTKVTVTREEVTSNVFRKLQLDCALLAGSKRTLLREVDRLEREVVGFRAVISYLEHRLGMESSQ